jgi:hypothetical protein
MSVVVWTILYLATASIWVWLLVNRNAEKWAHQWFMRFLIRDAWGSNYGPDTLRLFAWFCLTIETILYIVGIASPSARNWLAFF